MPLAGTQLSVQQAADYAKQAGWSGPALVTLVAIAICESDLYTHATNPSDPNGGSFGILQINASHFGKPFGSPIGPDQYVMSQSAAYDPFLSFLYAQPLSNYGRDFSPWTTYKNGCYLGHVDAVRSQIGSGGGGSSQVQFPPYYGTPWYRYGVYSDYPDTSYHNTDVGTPPETPLTAPLAGTITDLGYFDWGGQVTVKVDDPSKNSGYKDYFLIHLDAINPYLAVGQHVNAGDFLGYSGGENTLADPRLRPLPLGLSHHITQPAHSTGPHLDIGVGNTPDASWDLSKAASDALVYQALANNLPFGTGQGSPQTTTPPPGGGSIICQMFPWACQNGIPPATGGQGSALAQQIHNTLVQYPGFFGICKAIDEANYFPGFINDIPSDAGLGDISGTLSGIGQSAADTIIGNSIPLAMRALLVVVGVFLILALLWQLAKPQLEALPSLIQISGSQAGKAAAMLV